MSDVSKASRPPGKVVTFYSYKGGTGRSMALANFAWIMAASGKRVVTVDWDLEAPGLHRYFRPFLADSDLTETDGLIDAFWQFAATALASTSQSPENRLTGSHRDDIAGALEDSTRRLNQEFVTGGYIDFICAGRQGATYSERVNTFDWKRFYELGGAEMVRAARDYLRGRYDWVLVDSRTGVSDTSGICTIQLPDLVVACFTMNRQSVDGVSAILRSIRAYRGPTTDGSKITFYPMATRIENSESTRLQVARVYARGLMLQYLPEGARNNPREYWDKMETSYRPAYAFEEVLAAFGDASGARGAADTMLSQMQNMAQMIASNPELRVPEVLEDDRLRVLERYAFDGKRPENGAASQPALPKEQSKDNEFRRNIIAKEQLWRSKEFSWRWLLSRRELDLLTDADQQQFGREVSMFITQSRRAHQLFKRMDRAFYFAAGLFVFMSTGWLSGFYFKLRAPEEVMVYTRLIEPLQWLSFIVPFVVLLSSGIVNTLREEVPYGLSSARVIALTLIAPLRGRIFDYEAQQ